MAIIWALREAGRRERERRAMRQWSFSTYELSDTDPVGALAFEVVFLPAKPDSDGGRRVVDLSPFARQDRVGPKVAARAEALLDWLLGAAPAGSDSDAAEGRLAGWSPALNPEPPPVESTQRRFVRAVRCPTCADEFDWFEDGTVFLFDETTSRYESAGIGSWEPVKQADARRRGYRRCPNPSADTPEHYLPATYADYEDPLVIGLVGMSLSGKTHLLTAMLREVYRGGLQPFGLRHAALDFRRHQAFRRGFIERLERGEALPGTGSEVVDAMDAVILRGPGGPRPITFFDVAGEDLVRHDVHGKAARFLLAVNAVIFVHAPEDRPTRGGFGENEAFDLAVERIVAARGGAPVAAAIALTKSDRLRYVPPADRWLRKEQSHLSATDMRAESRDVFAYLHHSGTTAALNPFPEFPRCTLHFVSASGRDASSAGASSRFAGGIRPARVLQPLIAILAMTGVLTGPEAEKVGAP
ncbi:hypothetical protein [Pseudonocardia lacus]|uniref:hypothetical protein n=1 Tax=Pseudonocardia lacus TaxID=2835865 RepID=UPI001BDCC8A3|nr:hypothetical protein [Pseudonocardia lacus]